MMKFMNEGVCKDCHEELGLNDEGLCEPCTLLTSEDARSDDNQIMPDYGDRFHLIPQLFEDI